MPEKKTLERVRQDQREGKPASRQAGEFVREEFEHVKSGKHRVANRKQAIAIGLSKAREAGVHIGPPPRKAKAKSKVGASSATARGAKKTAQARGPSNGANGKSTAKNGASTKAASTGKAAKSSGRSGAAGTTTKTSATKARAASNGRSKAKSGARGAAKKNGAVEKRG